MERRSSQRASWMVRGGYCLVAMVGLAAPLEAASPKVAFDMSYTAEARDVTPRNFAETYPDRRVLEAQFRISTRIESGLEADLAEILIEITSPEQEWQIVDLLPRTELDTDIAGEIEVVENVEDTRTSNTGLTGNVGVEYGIIKAQAAPALGGGKTHAAGTKETYKRIPPRQLLVASGTTHRGHGVFFKLKPSPRESLEGVREFACLFVAPADWTGQSVRVMCVARGTKKSYFATKPQTCGEGVFHVGLFLEGNVEAREVAHEVARAQVTGFDAEGNPHSESSHAFSAFKPLVGASKSLFICPAPPKRDGSRPKDRNDSASYDREPRSLDDAVDSLNQLAGNRDR